MSLKVPAIGLTPPASPTTPASSLSDLGSAIVHLPFLGHVGVAYDANPRYRPSNEDTYVIHPELVAPAMNRCHLGSGPAPSAFLAVYDGHGGCDVAEAAADSLHVKFRERLIRDRCAVAAAMRAAYVALDAELRAARMFRTGATAVTVYVHADAAGRRVLTTANVGDARAVLSRAGRPVRLSCDHRAGEENERRRIEKAGGFVCAKRVNGILEVSRALGDHALKSVVVCEPSLRETVLCEADEFLILACDGLWDWIDDQTAVGIASDAFDSGCSPHGVAKALVDASLKAGCTDNISIIVVRFDHF
jgi:protein phosphatase PTC1